MHFAGLLTGLEPVVVGVEQLAEGVVGALVAPERRAPSVGLQLPDLVAEAADERPRLVRGRDRHARVIRLILWARKVVL